MYANQLMTAFADYERDLYFCETLGEAISNDEEVRAECGGELMWDDAYPINESEAANGPDDRYGG